VAKKNQIISRVHIKQTTSKESMQVLEWLQLWVNHTKRN